MVGIVMTHLKYLSLDTFLRYFDCLNMIPCVSMESFTKNHVETGIFPYGLCIILVRYGSYSNGSPKISFFIYFLMIFDCLNMIPCVSMESFTKIHVETGIH
jgi:hypothetical protein